MNSAAGGREERATSVSVFMETFLRRRKAKLREKLLKRLEKFGRIFKKHSDDYLG